MQNIITTILAYLTISFILYLALIQIASITSGYAAIVGLNKQLKLQTIPASA
jgi:hypothetical protein